MNSNDKKAKLVALLLAITIALIGLYALYQNTP